MGSHSRECAAIGLLLTHLELRILLVDDVEASLTTYKLAVVVTLLDRNFDFHLFLCYSLEAATLVPANV